MLLLLYPAWAPPPAPPQVVTIAYVRAAPSTSAVLNIVSPLRVSLVLSHIADASVALDAPTDAHALLTAPTEATFDG